MGMEIGNSPSAQCFYQSELPACGRNAPMLNYRAKIQLTTPESLISLGFVGVLNAVGEMLELVSAHTLAQTA